MRIIKPILWTVFGMVIGVTATVTASRVEAQQKPPAERIRVSPYTGADRSGLGGVYFVKDIKSGGCWIGAMDSTHWTTLAVAPATACD